MRCLRVDLVGDGLRRVRDRRLRPPHPRLARVDHERDVDHPRDGVTDLSGLVHHNDAGSQYTSIAFTERLAAAGVDASVGNVGDALDNALAESVIGLFKTELIRRRGP